MSAHDHAQLFILGMVLMLAGCTSAPRSTDVLAVAHEFFNKSDYVQARTALLRYKGEPTMYYLWLSAAIEGTLAVEQLARPDQAARAVVALHGATSILEHIYPALDDDDEFGMLCKHLAVSFRLKLFEHAMKANLLTWKSHMDSITNFATDTDSEEIKDIFRAFLLESTEAEKAIDQPEVGP